MDKDLKVNARVGWRPSTIARAKQAATEAGMSTSAWTEAVILDCLEDLAAIREGVAAHERGETIPCQAAPECRPENDPRNYSPQAWYEERHGSDHE